jgi:hypothetical protein
MTETLVVSQVGSAYTDDVAVSLKQNRYWVGNALDEANIAKDDWVAFGDTWSDLRTDQFLADGSTYRQRRFSKVVLDAASGDVDIAPHAAFFQSMDINRLHGGVQRMFEPCAAELLAGAAFLGLLGFVADVVGHGQAACQWQVHVHQHRVLARAGVAGLPTPEGVHRDGVDFVFMMLVERHGVEGGRSSLYDSEGNRVDAHELIQPGECILVDDSRLLHDVSPISRTGESGDGHRDMFFLEFTRQAAK